MTQADFIVPKFGLDYLGLKNTGTVHWNLSVPALYEEAIRRREGLIGQGGALVVRTGVHTGRSPNDKFIVEDSESKGRVDWGKTNKPISPAQYRALYSRMIAYAQRRRGERKRPASGWASLTPTERDVVRLVSEGLANNDIATRLFVSPRTVQTHLTYVYTKLGLTSRVQLAQEAARHGRQKP